MNDWQILKNKLRYINANDIARMADDNKRNRKAGEDIESIDFELGRVGITTFRLVGVVDDDQGSIVSLKEPATQALEERNPISLTEVSNDSTTNIKELKRKIDAMVITPLPSIPVEAIKFDDYMTEKEASLKFGKTRKWFSNSRYKKAGPPFIKVDNRILYPIFGLLEYFGEKND